MSDEKKFKFKWFEKLKNVKHIEIYISILFVVVLLLIYLSSSQTGKTKSSTGNQTDMSVTGYIESLETDLVEVISNINGVSNVKVLITLDMSQTSVENSQITINTFPQIKGIIITAKGLNDTAKRLKVLRAVEAVIDVTNGNIEILSSE